jgi:hypothetical protein
MATCPGRLAATALCILTAMLHAAAQTPAPSGPASFDALKSATTLTAAQSAQLKSMVEERIAALIGDAPDAANEAMKALRGATNGGTAAYREALTSALTATATPMLGRAELPGAVRLLTVLGWTRSAEVSEALTNALRDERPAVRAAAAVQLRALRAPLLQVGGQYLRRAVEGLVAAAKNETSAATLEKIYEAMNLGEVNANQSADTIRNFLDVLAARQAMYAADRVPAEGAELAALTAMSRYAKGLGGNEQRAYGVFLGTLLRYYVDVYTTDQPGEPALMKVQDTDGREMTDRRNAAEKIILETERQLNLMLGENAERDVAGALRNADPTKAKIAYNAWAKLLTDKFPGTDFALHRK